MINHINHANEAGPGFTRKDLHLEDIEIPEEVLSVLKTTRGKAHALSLLSAKYGDDACDYVEAYFATQEGRASGDKNSKNTVVAHNRSQKIYLPEQGFPKKPAAEAPVENVGFLKRWFRF
jgi:hypothetical protein